MKKLYLVLFSAITALHLTAQSTYDQDVPFGFCTVSSRTDATKTYNITGGGCYTYPIPESLADKAIVLKSNGQDMKGTIQNAIKQKDIIILDGSDGDFIVSSSIGFERGNKTIIGINNARLCTEWYITDEIRQALNDAGVPSMSTSSNTGGTLSNGTKVSEEAEYNTRQIIIDKTNDKSESYRNSGIFSLNKENVIIRNITFVGPGSIDVGGVDLISATGAKHCWVDHCTFLDGMDGNFDITNSSDFITVSWCVFRYTDRSYMHQNTNLVGSSDSEATGYLNTTFAFNWWATGCKQRMPMARVGKIHMLNNYFSCTGAGNCINPRKNSEFLIEGNYFASGVNNFYSQSDAIAVTWASSNFHASKSIPSSIGSAVTVPYTYTVAPYADIPDVVQANAGATLSYGSNSGKEDTGIKGSIYWAMSANTNGTVADAIADNIVSTKVTNGDNLTLRTNGTYGDICFSLYQAQSIQTEPTNDNTVTFAFTTKSGQQFKATSVELYACKVGTNNGKLDIAWQDAGEKVTLWEGVSPNRNNTENNYWSYYSRDISSNSTATDGTCSLIINLYNVGATDKDTGALQKKDIGLAQVNIKGYIIDTPTGISIPVTLSPVMNTEYYNIAGQRVGSNAKGIVIMKQRLENGQVVTKKILK